MIRGWDPLAAIVVLDSAIRRAAAARVVTAPSTVGIDSPTNWGVLAKEGALSPCQRLADVVLSER
jgi:hypothetical protein